MKVKILGLVVFMFILSGCEMHYKSTSSSDIVGDSTTTETTSTTDSSTNTDDNSEDTTDIDVTAGDSSPVDVDT
jgi:hypothetical protein